MQHAANVTSGDVLDWHAIDWKRVYRTVKNLRQRIFRASRANDLTRVRSLQRLMLRCQANVLESVRRVTRVNQGKDTPGVDQVVITTPEERGWLCAQLSYLDLHLVRPVRRVYIPKRKDKRPLGIPTSRRAVAARAAAQLALRLALGSSGYRMSVRRLQRVVVSAALRVTPPGASAGVGAAYPIGQ